MYSFLRAEAFDPPCPDDKRPLFKTPSVANLEHFFEFFPDASLLILVRDGRDTVESSVRSFGGTYEHWTRTWCTAAHVVLDFDRKHRGSAAYRLARYEDLVRDPVESLREVLTFLGLDPAMYDFQAARQLPVFGSSSFRGHRADLHWEPVEKSQGFEPVGRWKTWSPYRQRRFAWSAGEAMTALGYDLHSAPSWWQRAQHRLVDSALRVATRLAARGANRRSGEG